MNQNLSSAFDYIHVPTERQNKSDIENPKPTALNTSTKSRPIILRFFSGSVTPSRSLKNFSLASTPITFKPSPLYASITLVNSFLRSIPWSTNIQVRFLPIALLSNVAQTEESTPPERPRITRSLPNCFFSSSTVLSTKEAGLHSCLLLQMSTTKFFSSCVP